MGMALFTIAHGACSPILLLSGAGRVSDEDTGRRKGMVAGTWRDQWMTTGVTKLGKTILTGDRVWEHTAEAFRQMKTGIPQSTHLIFPSDVLGARFESPRQLSYRYDKSRYRTEASPHPEPKAVTAAIDLLRQARRPMIVCGQGVFAKKAWDDAGSGDRPRKEHLDLFQENLRYDKVAEALGCHGEYVTEAAEVLPALRRASDVAVNDRMPTVLNVQGRKEFWDASLYPPGILWARSSRASGPTPTDRAAGLRCARRRRGWFGTG